MSSLTYFCLFAIIFWNLAAAEEPYPLPVDDSPASATAAESNILPEEFYGLFDVDHSENFEEYLNEKGYSWFTRKLILFASFQKRFSKTSEKTKFDFSNLTSVRDTNYKNVTLGESFEGNGLDGNKANITFTLKDGHVYEHHIPLEKGVAKQETYKYFFENDFLVVSMSCNGIEGRRFHKRIVD